jgi:hypothetical protein
MSGLHRRDAEALRIVVRKNGCSLRLCGSAVEKRELRSISRQMDATRKVELIETYEHVLR